jgi:hypothetical protein
MVNLQALVDHYLLDLVLTKDEKTELTIRPQQANRGLEMVLYGSFDSDPLSGCSLTAFRVAGFMEDALDEDIDESLYFNMAKAILEGDYSYDMKTAKWMDKIWGGAVYLNIGLKDESLVKDFRCVNQKGMKKMYAQGQLKTAAYVKKV